METAFVADRPQGGTRFTATPGASPYTFQNTGFQTEIVIVQGGTVTTIEFSRDGTQFDICGILAGLFLLCPGDRLRVTYLVAPTLTIYPV